MHGHGMARLTLCVAGSMVKTFAPTPMANSRAKQLSVVMEGAVVFRVAFATAISHGLSATLKTMGSRKLDFLKTKRCNGKHFRRQQQQ